MVMALLVLAPAAVVYCLVALALFGAGLYIRRTSLSGANRTLGLGLSLVAGAFMLLPVGVVVLVGGRAYYEHLVVPSAAELAGRHVLSEVSARAVQSEGIDAAGIVLDLRDDGTFVLEGARTDGILHSGTWRCNNAEPLGPRCSSLVLEGRPSTTSTPAFVPAATYANLESDMDGYEVRVYTHGQLAQPFTGGMLAFVRAP